jgi:hypothetical protein
VAACCLASVVGRGGEPEPDDRGPAAEAAKVEPLSVDAARRQARVLHRVYSATLDAMHHYYFHANKAVIPARAMEDIFADAADETQATSRWISVNTKAMGVDHEPADEFERSAAAALSKGAGEFELVENGVYRRAGAIPLSAGCIGCHAGATAKPTKIPRVAGLVISIPVSQD